MTYDWTRPERLSFRSVNRSGSPGYDPGLQRHHLLPRQLIGARCFGTMFDAVGLDRVGFEDFRRNGLLLPANDRTAVRMALPLHRGPHRQYNELVIERVGMIESRWSKVRSTDPKGALEQALMQLTLLQRTLRRRLLSSTMRSALNRRAPIRTEEDFAELDAMAEMLWGETGG